MSKFFVAFKSAAMSRTKSNVSEGVKKFDIARERRVRLWL